MVMPVTTPTLIKTMREIADEVERGDSFDMEVKNFLRAGAQRLQEYYDAPKRSVPSDLATPSNDGEASDDN